MATERFLGLMSQPNCAPLAMYSSIFSPSRRGRSVADCSSMTKSGQRLPKSVLTPLVQSLDAALRRRPGRIGRARAPLGSTYPAEDPQEIPRPSCSAQAPNRAAKFEQRTPVKVWLGGATGISPSAVISMKRSGCPAQNATNSLSVIGLAVIVAADKYRRSLGHRPSLAP